MNTKAIGIIFEALDFLLRAKGTFNPTAFQELKTCLIHNGWIYAPDIESMLQNSNFLREFKDIANRVQNDSSQLVSLQKLCYSVNFLDDLFNLVRDTELFKSLVLSLKFENPFLTLAEVNHNLNQALEKQPRSINLKVRRLFAESIASDMLDFSQEDLQNAAEILADEQLYIEALSLLQYHISQNHAWVYAYEAVRELDGSKKPESQQQFEMLLWHHHAKKTSTDPDNWYESYCDYTFVSPDQAPSASLDIGDQLSQLSLKSGKEL